MSLYGDQKNVVNRKTIDTLMAKMKTDNHLLKVRTDCFISGKDVSEDV